MTDTSLRSSAIALVVAGILHLMVAVLSGFTAAALTQSLWAFCAWILAAGLLAGWRWMAWVAFWAGIIAIGTIAGQVGRAVVPDIALYGQVAAYAAAVFWVFLSLWRGRPKGQA